MKEPYCIHCKKPIAILGGFEHDEIGNMLCTLCKNVIFAVSKSPAEEKLKASIPNNQYAWQKKECLPIRL